MPSREMRPEPVQERVYQNTWDFFPDDGFIPECYFCGEKRRMMGTSEERKVLEQVGKEGEAGGRERLPSLTE